MIRHLVLAARSSRNMRIEGTRLLVASPSLGVLQGGGVLSIACMYVITLYCTKQP